MRFPAGVHFVTDRQRCDGRPLEWVVEWALAGGAAAVHLRESDLPAAELYKVAVRLRAVTAGRCALVINDRVDIALAVGADGAQLGRRSLPVAAARRIAETRLRIGRSVHSLTEAIEAERDGADYVLLGTLYPTASHPEVVPVGPGLVRRVRERLELPVAGIGGITAANAAEVIEAGADGVAVITAISLAADVEAATRELVAVVAQARRSLEESEC